MVVMVFIRFSVTGAGHAAGSLPDLLFYAKCDGCDWEGVGWEVRYFDGKFLPSGAIWSTKAPLAHAAGYCVPQE